MNEEYLFLGVFVVVVLAIVATWIYRFIEYRRDLNKAPIFRFKRRRWRDQA